MSAAWKESLDVGDDPETCVHCRGFRKEEHTHCCYCGAWSGKLSPQQIIAQNYDRLESLRPSCPHCDGKGGFCACGPPGLRVNHVASCGTWRACDRCDQGVMPWEQFWTYLQRAVAITQAADAAEIGWMSGNVWFNAMEHCTARDLLNTLRAIQSDNPEGMRS